MPSNVIYVDGYAAPIALPPAPPAPEPPPPPPQPEPAPPPPDVQPEPPQDALLPPGRTGPPPPGVVYIVAPPADPPPAPPVVPSVPEPPSDALVPSQGPRPSVAPPGTVYYPAPPAEPVDGSGAGGEGDTGGADPRPGFGARGESLLDYGDPLDEARFLAATNPPLEGQAFIQAMRDVALALDLDPLGMAANGLSEGFGGGIGDSGNAYGPWQDHLTEYRGRPWYGKGKNNPTVNAWAWSKAGIQYVGRSMVNGGCAGVHGHRSAYLICTNYEKPANVRAQALLRQDVYDQLAAMPAGVWDFLAGRAKGPAGGAGAQTTPTPAPAPVATNMATWRGLIASLRDDVPAAGVHMQNVARRLKGTVT